MSKLGAAIGVATAVGQPSAIAPVRRRCSCRRTELQDSARSKHESKQHISRVSRRGEAAANNGRMQKLDPVIAGLSHVIAANWQGRASISRRGGGGHREARDRHRAARAVSRARDRSGSDPRPGKAAFQKTERARNPSAARFAGRCGRRSRRIGHGWIFRRRWRLSPDASLAPGSAIFETSRGELDASVDTQLAEIDRGFADLCQEAGAINAHARLT